MPHDSDWTYSLAFPLTHPWYSLRAEVSYERLHAWLRESFARLGVGAILAPCCAKEAPGQCFAGPEKFDLVWEGRKIAGAAQRRTKWGLLIQGSIQRQPESVTRAAWEDALTRSGSEQWGIEWVPFVPSSDTFELEVNSLLQARYSQPAFHHRR